jgi:hypothetical protein
VALLLGSAVLVSQRVGEAAVEVAFLKVQYTVFAIRNVFREEVVEVVRLERQKDTATVGESGRQNQIEKEFSKTPGLTGRRRRRGRERSLSSCISLALGTIKRVQWTMGVEPGDGLGTVSGGIGDSEEGAAGVGDAGTGGLASAKNLCIRCH